MFLTRKRKNNPPISELAIIQRRKLPLDCQFYLKGPGELMRSRSPSQTLKQNHTVIAKCPTRTLSPNPILALRAEKSGPSPSRGAPVPPSSDQSPHHGCRQHAPGAAVPCGATGGVASRLSGCHPPENPVHLGRGAAPKQTGPGSSARLPPPPTHSSMPRPPSLRRPRESEADETRPQKQTGAEIKLKTGRSINRGGRPELQLCPLLSSRASVAWTLPLSPKDAKSKFAAFDNDCTPVGHAPMYLFSFFQPIFLS